jgi:hypothetical protein
VVWLFSVESFEFLSGDSFSNQDFFNGLVITVAESKQSFSREASVVNTMFANLNPRACASPLAQGLRATLKGIGVDSG